MTKQHYTTLHNTAQPTTTLHKITNLLAHYTKLSNTSQNCPALHTNNFTAVCLLCTDTIGEYWLLNTHN